MPTYVIDTSVLLSDPRAPERLAADVVIPLQVVSELEGKRTDPELGYFAREALRFLDDLRHQHGRLDSPIPMGGGGTLRVELNTHGCTGDTQVLAVARSIDALDGQDVVLVTKDLPMRVKAAAAGVTADEYNTELLPTVGWTGLEHIDVAPGVVGDLYRDGSSWCQEADGILCHAGVVVHDGTSSALTRTDGRGNLTLVRDREAFGVRGRSAAQRVALDILLDPSVGIVSMGGRAGTGKSALALCAGLEEVLENGRHRKIMVFRPMYAVGGQDLGYLPGSEGEKMAPWAQAVFDTLGAVSSPQVIEEVMARGLIEVLPLTHIRGRSLHDAFVIVDEAQSLERQVLLTVLSRIGQGSRVILTHDVAQRDNLRVGRHDGVSSVVEKLKGHHLFAHITLTRSERSEIAALVTEMLDG